MRYIVTIQLATGELYTEYLTLDNKVTVPAGAKWYIHPTSSEAMIPALDVSINLEPKNITEEALEQWQQLLRQASLPRDLKNIPEPRL